MKSKLGLDHWSQLVAIKSISMIRNAYEMKFLSCIPTHSKSSWVWNTGHNTSLLKVLSMVINELLFVYNHILQDRFGSLDTTRPHFCCLFNYKRQCGKVPFCRRSSSELTDINKLKLRFSYFVKNFKMVLKFNVLKHTTTPHKK